MTTLLAVFLLIAVFALAYTFFDGPKQRESRHITQLARDSVKRALRGKSKRGYRHVQAGWRGCP